jgi:CheY-like chemotaxis protein
LRQGLSLSTRLTIAIVTLVMLTAGTVGFLGYRNIEAIAVLIAILSAYILAQTLTRPLTQMTAAVASFAEDATPRNVDINAMVRDTANLLRPTLGEHIEIEAVLEQNAEPARIDPSQLATALLNLAVNARDAMPNGGKLTLKTDNVVLDDAYAQANPEVRPGDYVLIAVSDTGSGIPARLRDKLFEPFFTTKKIGKGTGLGLSMVYGFVKQSNGHIKIYSEEGHGTTIKLYLPRATANADAPAPAAPAIIGGDETIMVVEDDPLVRNFVVTQLHSLGYKTMTAASGDLALAQLDDGAVFDLLLTDVIMPGGINGRQLADTVNLRRPAVKVLYTSGYTENAIVHHGRLDVGALLLTKPYRRSDLARLVRMALDGDPAITAGIGDAPDNTGDGALFSAPPSASRGRIAGA